MSGGKPPAGARSRTVRGRCTVDFATMARGPNNETITVPGIHTFSNGDGSVRVVVLAGSEGDAAVCDFSIPQVLADEWSGILARMAKFSRERKVTGVALGLPMWGSERTGMAAGAPSAGVAAILGTASTEPPPPSPSEGDPKEWP